MQDDSYELTYDRFNELIARYESEMPFLRTIERGPDGGWGENPILSGDPESEHVLVFGRDAKIVRELDEHDLETRKTDN